ncbi:hypothetical protein HAX54_016839 [Datura stramonium]|uniref:Uncharacterized protein n=1 Tax=Datura stramonium TaxID=4076 RepID=A0ABS8UMK4_DATST|nr:hypothetical protein [Datura stramonium]
MSKEIGLSSLDGIDIDDPICHPQERHRIWFKESTYEDMLPSTDIVMAKPLHGSDLSCLGFVPEFRDKFLPIVSQEMKDETTAGVKFEEPPRRSVAHP